MTAQEPDDLYPPVNSLTGVIAPQEWQPEPPPDRFDETLSQVLAARLAVADRIAALRQHRDDTEAEIKRLLSQQDILNSMARIAARAEGRDT